MSGFIKERFNFSYESNAALSYLVLGLSTDEKVIDYQIEMIANNPSPSVLPLDLRQKNDKINVYYNITSKLALSQFLARKKLKRNEFIDILRNITKAILECKDFFLWDKNFLIHEDYIYINPGSLETSMVYLPIEIDGDVCSEFKSLMKRLTGDLAQIDENCTDNFMLRILNELKKDVFNIKDFSSLLSELRGASPAAAMERKAAEEYEQVDRDSSIQKGSVPTFEPRVEQRREPVKPVKEDKPEPFVRPQPADMEKPVEYQVKKKYKKNILIVTVLSQVLLILLIALLVMTVLKGAEMTSFAGLVIMIGAIDFLILRKLLDKKNLEEVKVPVKGKGAESKSSKGAKPAKEKGAEKFEAPKERPVDIPRGRVSEVPKDFGRVDNINIAKREISSGRSEVSPASEILLSEDTEVLSVSKGSSPYLISNKDGMAEKIYINKPSFVIGRLKGQADYVSANNAVGKMHAEIRSRNGQYFIMDLNSKNGTFINGMRLTGSVEYELNENDEITLANSSFIFRMS